MSDTRKTSQNQDHEETPQELNLLHRMPQEMIVKIACNGGEYPDDASISLMNSLSQTCLSFFQICNPLLNQQGQQKLLTCVLQGNLKEAQQIYSSNPILLFLKTTYKVKEYAAGLDENGKAVYREVAASPFGAALRAGDIWMLQDMSCYIDKVKYSTGETGREIALAQCQEYFPNGFDYLEITEEEVQYFQNIINTITQDFMLRVEGTPSEETNRIIAQFRKDFLPAHEKTGHLFNLRYLAFIHKKATDHQSTWSATQSNLFFCQILGYLQRLASAVDAIAYSYSMKKIVGNALIRRSFEFLNPSPFFNDIKKTEYFPLLDEEGMRLGVDCALSSSDCSYATRFCSFLDPFMPNWVGKYMKMKTDCMQEFKEYLKQAVATLQLK